MTSTMEIREKQKHLLGILLKLKKNNNKTTVTGLQEEIIDAVTVMDKEDVAWVEKIIGEKAL